MANLNERLRHLRIQNKFTQEDLAQMLRERFDLKTDRAMISKWETGFQTPSVHTIGCLAEIFGVSMDYLNGRTDDINPLIYPNIIPIEEKRIPVLGSIACGTPVYADENFESYAACGAGVRADFALRCRGDSMINARINDGDIVFIRSQSTVNNGEIACVLIDDEATLKRVYIDGSTVTLVSENPKYAPLVYSADEGHEIQIIGKAIAFQSDIK